MNFKKIKAKEKKWLLNDAEGIDSVAIGEISRAMGLNPIIAKLLYTRGCKDVASAKKFLYMESEILTDANEMADMPKATARIEKAIKGGEKIAIYGDYDVDGVTSVCTLYLYLKSRGADVMYYIPNRIGEGYGVSSSAIDMLHDAGAKLIITVDTGITADVEVEYARTLGIDFVVTDHHECRQTLPLADAVVNPHRPDCPSKFKEIAGVGVVFKLLSALEQRLSGSDMAEAAIRIIGEYSDLIAIGTIADVMPIKEENRLIVSYGLRMIEKSPRVGIAALIAAASGKNEAQRFANRKKQTKITSGYIGFTLAPRINAAGRIRSASLAVELFLSEDYTKAYAIAEELCEANKERQNEENRITQEAYKIIESKKYDENAVIVLESDDWHHGVIGIVSSRITEKYFRPSILVSFEGSSEGEISGSDVGKGSGRSVKGLNLVDALCYCKDELVKFGGHELAAGLSVTRDKLDSFRSKINEYAEANLDEDNLVPVVPCDLEIALEDVNISLAEGLRILEPYGISNPIPAFVVKRALLAEISSVSEGKHSRITLSNGKNTISGMYFSHPSDSLGLYVGDEVDVLFNVDVNEWAGHKSAQMIIRDIRPSEAQKESYCESEKRFSEIWNGAPISQDEDVIPTRDDFAVAYRLISNLVRGGNDRFCVRDILSRLKANGVTSVGFVKLSVIIKVMQELNIMGITEISEGEYCFSVQYRSTKAELDKSTLLRRLRSQIKQ